MSATSKDGLFAVCGSFMALSTIAVGVRFYARKYQKISLGPDDFFALFGVVTYLATAGLAITLAVWNEDGYGPLTPEQKAHRAKPTIQVSFAYDFLNINVLACAKLSALFMYRRIFTVDRNGWFNRVIWATVAIIAAWYVTSDFLSLYQCPGHFSAAWDGNFKKYCVLNPVWAKELAITDFILDVWVLVLPIIPILRLHTTLARKLSIFGVFCLAFVGLGAAIARIVFFAEAHGGSRQVTYIAMLEEGISITVVNLPSIYHLCTSVVPDRVARSLRSIRSVRSDDSQQLSNAPSEGDLRMLEEQKKTPVHISSVDAKSSISSQGSSFGPGNRTDVEAGRVEAYDMQDLSSYRQDSAPGIAHDRIHVRNDVDVTRH